MAGTTILMAGALLAGAADEPQLTGRLAKTLDAVVETYNRGDAVGMGQLLAQRVVRLQTAQRTAFDAALAERGVPSVGELLVSVRMTLEAQKQDKALPRLTFNERLLMLHGVDTRVSGALLSAAEQVAAYEKLPAPRKLGDFEARLRLFDTVRRQLAVARTWAKYGTGLASEIVGERLGRLEAADREVVDASNRQREKIVSRTERDMEEVQMEIRLARLRFGVDVLKDPELSKERFLAARTTGVDANILQQFLKPAAQPADGNGSAPADEAKPASFTRAALNEPGLAQKVADLHRQAGELAGDLTKKVSLLFDGLGWWLRGRFGRGPDVGGLAKSAAALKDQKQLLAVSMPPELPAPVAPGDFVRMKPTHIDRRHHYIWAWEDRKLVRDGWYVKGNQRPYKLGEWDALRTDERLFRGHSEGVHKNGQPNIFDTETRRFTSTQVTYVPPQDPRLVFRLVGFVEYGKAVELLDEFVQEASTHELEVADEIIRERDAFVVYTNLSRQIEGRSLLSENSDNPRDDFARRGLEWVLALARVELGAMLAGFTSVQKPFHVVAPTRKSPRYPQAYGREAFREVLTDGMRMHYWTLKRDPAVWSYHKRGVPENHLLTYGRRVTVAQHFLHAGRQAWVTQLSNRQVAELARWEQELAKVHRMLLYCLSLKVGKESFELTSWMTYYKDSGGGDTRGVTRNRKRSRNPLTDKLLLIDPTLIACPCR